MHRISYDDVISLLVNSLSLLLSFLPSPSCKAEKERFQGWWCWAEAEVDKREVASTTASKRGRRRQR